MFNSRHKSEVKEFEHMRQVFRPADRPAEVADGDRTEKPAGANDQATSAVTSNISVTTAPFVRPAGDSLATHPDKCSSIISTGSTWDGSLTIEGSVRVDGIMSGEIEARGTVHVSKGAEVDAKVRAAYLVVAGVFRGEALCGERLEILPTGRVTGQLTTKSLVVHEGSFLEGQLRMTDEQAAVEPAPAKGAKSVNGSARALTKPVEAVAAPQPLVRGESA